MLGKNFAMSSRSTHGKQRCKSRARAACAGLCSPRRRRSCIFASHRCRAASRSVRTRLHRCTCPIRPTRCSCTSDSAFRCYSCRMLGSQRCNLPYAGSRRYRVPSGSRSFSPAASKTRRPSRLDTRKCPRCTGPYRFATPGAGLLLVGDSFSSTAAHAPFAPHVARTRPTLRSGTTVAAWLARGASGRSLHPPLVSLPPPESTCTSTGSSGYPKMVLHAASIKSSPTRLRILIAANLLPPAPLPISNILMLRASSVGPKTA